MKKQYEFAGVELEISISDQWMYSDERVLEAFQTRGLSQPHQFHMEIVDALPTPKGAPLTAMPGYCVFGNGENQERYIGSVEQGWQHAYLCAGHNGKEHLIQLKASEYTDVIGVKTVLNAMAAEHLVLEKQGVILHASFIEQDGQAILFTAPSGTGKSTQAQLWADLRDADIINGDRAVIRLIDGNPYACGIPFAGSSKHCKNATLPLAAIVYLGQAPRTTIERIEPPAAFRKIWEECTVNTWNANDVEKATNILLDIIIQTPIYYLQCTPDESAVFALEAELNKL